MDLNDLFRKPDDADFEENDEKEELDNIIVLNDEDGNEVEFEFLDIVECDGSEYIVLMPVEDADNGEVAICRVEGEDDNESYIGVDNEDEAQRVFMVFKEKNKVDFTFMD